LTELSHAFTCDGELECFPTALCCLLSGSKQWNQVLSRGLRTNVFLIDLPITQHVSTLYLSISLSLCARWASSTLISFTYSRLLKVSMFSRRYGSNFWSSLKELNAESTSVDTKVIKQSMRKLFLLHRTLRQTSAKSLPVATTFYLSQHFLTNCVMFYPSRQLLALYNLFILCIVIIS